MQNKIPAQKNTTGKNIPYIPDKEYDTKIEPNISLKYLSKMNGGCFVSVFKNRNKNESKAVFKELQEFINCFSTFENISKATSRYCSKNGLKIPKTNEKVKSIIKQFTTSFPNVDKNYISDSLDHLHAKPNGKGKTVYFGFSIDSTFYIIYIDPEHNF